MWNFPVFCCSSGAGNPLDGGFLGWVFFGMKGFWDRGVFGMKVFLRIFGMKRFWDEGSFWKEGFFEMKVFLNGGFLG